MPGDRFEDARLAEASTLDGASLCLLGSYFEEGGPDNMAACLAFITQGKAPAPRAVAAFGLYEPRPPSLLPPLRGKVSAKPTDEGRHNPHAPHPNPSREERERGLRALIVFYRSIYLADDLAPIDALANALEARGFAVTCSYVTSLKDAAVRAPLSELISREKFDVILNATAFSARLDEDGGGVLDEADAPVLQVVLAGAGARGLGGLDARAFARRPRDECRAARNRRAHSDARDILQAGAAARRKLAVLARRSCADGGPRRLCRRSRGSLGEASAHAAP